MAKKKDRVETVSVTKPRIPMTKYFQLYAPEVHKYTRAYLEEEFRGIIKEADDWKDLLNKEINGG